MAKNFIDLNLQISYISYGEGSIIDSLLIPALSITQTYKRSVGFFSSSVLKSLCGGLVGLVDNQGSMKIIASPKLSQEDIDIIDASYDKKDSVIKENILNDLKKSLLQVNFDERILLSELILSGVLDIKIVVTNKRGYYHDKLGILIDQWNNKIAFVGSSNETETGYEINYEKIRVFQSWESNNDYRHVEDEEKEFDRLWNGTNQFIKTYDFKEAIKEIAFEVIKMDPPPQDLTGGFQLRPYQLEAIQKWSENDYIGFYVMATGTGKTITALYGLNKLIDKEKVFTVIVVPYKHLVSQWYEDVTNIFPNFNIIKVLSEVSDWETQIKNVVIKNKYDKTTQPIIIISTLASFCLERFNNAIKNYIGRKTLIVDEAHRFYNKIKNGYDYSQYKYKLGLSATPVFGKNIQKAKDLLSFFGGKVFELTIDQAIGKYLVNYDYKPIFISISPENENKFKKITMQMTYCFDKNGVLIKPDKLIQLIRSRLRVLSMVDSKRDALIEYIKETNLVDHFIVYCGDGKLYANSGEELRHLDDVKKILNEYNYRPTQFTANESMQERMTIIELFSRGDITSLVAIKCLDEGINIPSIKTAIILSSGDDYREFVQRRGRILRMDNTKDKALIIDFIILPSLNSPEIAKIELRRYNEYAKLALKNEELQHELFTLLKRYDISYADIDFDEIIDSIDGGDTDD